MIMEKVKIWICRCPQCVAKKRAMKPAYRKKIKRATNKAIRKGKRSLYKVYYA